jgi:hypothetical protein
MNDAHQEAFEKAMADVFEGREVQFGHGPRKILREFYDRAVEDAGKHFPSKKAGAPVKQFSDLQVGDVFQNDYLRGLNRCRRVLAVYGPRELETEMVDTSNGKVVQTHRFNYNTFISFNNYSYIADPAKP